MKIHVIGTRGFPNIQGGVEKHCESLYSLIAKSGCHVKVYRRKPYLSSENAARSLEKIEFSDIWTPRHKNFETIIHSLIAAFYCLFEKPDIVHIHNIGPSLVIPLLKLARLRVLVTYHSANYEHSKWGWFAKKMLLLGESFVLRWANRVIFVSRTKYESIDSGRKVFIPNGVSIQLPSPSKEFLNLLGISPGKYILAVGRFVPEKGLHDLISAFKVLETDYKLILAGEADYETDYSRKLRKMAGEDDRVVLTGYITGEPLNELYSNAILFVLPSYQEGLPIVLLEALSYGLPVVASDIPANQEVSLPDNRYFRCGDVSDLKEKIQLHLEAKLSESTRQSIRRKIEDQYDWEKIAEQTIAVYQKVIGEQ